MGAVQAADGGGSSKKTPTPAPTPTPTPTNKPASKPTNQPTPAPTAKPPASKGQLSPEEEYRQIQAEKALGRNRTKPPERDGEPRKVSRKSSSPGSATSIPRSAPITKADQAQLRKQVQDKKAELDALNEGITRQDRGGREISKEALDRAEDLKKELAKSEGYLKNVNSYLNTVKAAAGAGKPSLKDLDARNTFTDSWIRNHGDRWWDKNRKNLPSDEAAYAKLGGIIDSAWKKKIGDDAYKAEQQRLGDFVGKAENLFRLIAEDHGSGDKKAITAAANRLLDQLGIPGNEKDRAEYKPLIDLITKAGNRVGGQSDLMRAEAQALYDAIKAQKKSEKLTEALVQSRKDKLTYSPDEWQKLRNELINDDKAAQERLRVAGENLSDAQLKHFASLVAKAANGESSKAIQDYFAKHAAPSGWSPELASLLGANMLTENQQEKVKAGDVDLSFFSKDAIDKAGDDYIDAQLDGLDLKEDDKRAAKNSFKELVDQLATNLGTRKERVNLSAGDPSLGDLAKAMLNGGDDTTPALLKHRGLLDKLPKPPTFESDEYQQWIKDPDGYAQRKARELLGFNKELVDVGEKEAKEIIASVFAAVDIRSDVAASDFARLFGAPGADRIDLSETDRGQIDTTRTPERIAALRRLETNLDATLSHSEREALLVRATKDRLTPEVADEIIRAMADYSGLDGRQAVDKIGAFFRDEAPDSPRKWSRMLLDSFKKNYKPEWGDARPLHELEIGPAQENYEAGLIAKKGAAYQSDPRTPGHSFGEGLAHLVESVDRPFLGTRWNSADEMKDWLVNAPTAADGATLLDLIGGKPPNAFSTEPDAPFSGLRAAAEKGSTGLAVALGKKFGQDAAAGKVSGFQLLHDHAGTSPSTLSKALADSLDEQVKAGTKTYNENRYSVLAKRGSEDFKARRDEILHPALKAQLNNPLYTTKHTLPPASDPKSTELLAGILWPDRKGKPEDGSHYNQNELDQINELREKLTTAGGSNPVFNVVVGIHESPTVGYEPRIMIQVENSPGAHKGIHGTPTGSAKPTFSKYAVSVPGPENRLIDVTAITENARGADSPVTFKDTQAYVEENRLPEEGRIYFPENLKPEVDQATGRMKIHWGPDGHQAGVKTAGESAKEVVDIVALGAALAAGVGLAAFTGGTSALAAAGLASSWAAAGATAAWGSYRALETLGDRSRHGQTNSLANPEARAAWLELATSALGAGAGRAGLRAAILAGKGLDAGAAGRLAKGLGVGAMAVGAGATVDQANTLFQAGSEATTKDWLFLGTSILGFGAGAAGHRLGRTALGNRARFGSNQPHEAGDAAPVSPQPVRITHPANHRAKPVTPGLGDQAIPPVRPVVSDGNGFDGHTPDSLRNDAGKLGQQAKDLEAAIKEKIGPERDALTTQRDLLLAQQARLLGDAEILDIGMELPAADRGASPGPDRLADGDILDRSAAKDGIPADARMAFGRNSDPDTLLQNAKILDTAIDAAKASLQGGKLSSKQREAIRERIEALERGRNANLFEAARQLEGAPSRRSTAGESLDDLLGRVLRMGDAVTRQGNIYSLYSRSDSPDPLTPVWDDITGLNTANTDYLRGILELGQGRPEGTAVLSQINQFTLADAVLRPLLDRRPLPDYNLDRAGQDFFHFATPFRIPDTAPVERIYINARSDHALDVMGFLVRDIIDRPDFFPGVENGKISGPDSGAKRRDNIVVYLEAPALPKVAEALSRYNRDHPEHFNDEVPLMTEKLGPGMSIGSEPLDASGNSFGQVRAGAIWQALSAARQVTKNPASPVFSTLFRDAVRTRLLDAQVDPLDPSVNLPKLAADDPLKTVELPDDVTPVRFDEAARRMRARQNLRTDIPPDATMTLGAGSTPPPNLPVPASQAPARGPLARLGRGMVDRYSISG